MESQNLSIGGGKNMAKVCKKCGRQIGFGEYSYNGECENCHKGTSRNTQQNSVNNQNNIGSMIVTFVIILIIVLPIILMFSSSKQDAERRKQKELREFDSQLHQDPSMWDKKQQDRYDSFMKWDSNNK